MRMKFEYKIEDIQRSEDGGYIIPEELMRYPYFVDTTGVIYCKDESHIIEFFTSVRREMQSEFDFPFAFVVDIITKNSFFINKP